jgi:uncharacterized cupredoxin-like copper-binding protein
MGRTTALRRWTIGGTAVVMAAALAACGSDDDSGDGGTEDAAASSSADGDVDAFCTASVEASTIVGQGPPVDFATATPEEIEAALAEYSGQLEPSLQEMEDTAPDDVSDDVTTLTGQVRQALETGDDSVFESEEYVSADRGIDGYMVDNCGFEQIEATGVDYEYEGIPATVPAGVTAVTFENQGEELHEVAMFRINDDVTASVEELLAMPEEQAMQNVTIAGFAFADPSETDTSFVTLEPGRYAAVCFIPQGTTHEMEGTGAPHFTLGMISEFTVE